jgi:hypothetical protein
LRRSIVVASLLVFACRTRRDEATPVVAEVQDTAFDDSVDLGVDAGVPKASLGFQDGHLPAGCIGDELELAHLGDCRCTQKRASHFGVGGKMTLELWTSCGDELEKRSLVDIIAIEGPTFLRVRSGDTAAIVFTMRNRTGVEQPVTFFGDYTPSGDDGLYFRTLDASGDDVTFAKGDTCRRFGTPSYDAHLFALAPYGTMGISFDWRAVSYKGHPPPLGKSRRCIEAGVALKPGNYEVEVPLHFSEKHGLPTTATVDVMVIP